MYWRRPRDRRRRGSMGVGHRRVIGQIIALVCTVSMAVGAQAAPPPGIPMSMARARMMIWPIKTREHVDLWLHGFAMIAGRRHHGGDSALSPGVS